GGRGDGPDVVDRRGLAAVHDAADPRGEQDGLGAARAAAEADVALDEVGGAAVGGGGGPEDSDDVRADARGDGDGADEPADLEQGGAVEHGLGAGALGAGGAIEN